MTLLPIKMNISISFKDLDLNKIREEFLHNGIDVMDFEIENSEMKVIPRPIIKRNPLVLLHTNIIHPNKTRKPTKPPQNVSILKFVISNTI